MIHLPLFKFELGQYLKSLFIWLLALSLFSIMVIFLYPQLAPQMESMSKMLDTMAIFSDALKISSAQMGTLFGFYTMEMQNSGAFAMAIFATYMGVRLISKEESDGTGEYLYTLPIPRLAAYWTKWWTNLLLFILLNAGILAITYLACLLSHQDFDWGMFGQFHLGLFLVQVILMSLAHAWSGIFAKGATPLASITTLLLFLLNILVNLWDKVEVLGYFTPFQFLQSNYLIDKGQLDWIKIGCNLIIAFIFLLLGAYRYSRRDLEV